MENRGILTEDDRAFLNGEKTVDDPDKTRREKKFNIRDRITNLNEDIDILREAGEEETIQLLYSVVGRYERVERRLQDIQDQLDEFK